MSDKSRVTLIKAKSENSVFHALRPNLSISTRSPFGTRSLIAKELSGRTYEASRNHDKDANNLSEGHDFSRVRIYPKGAIRTLSIRTKLRINKPGDIYEQEADRVTEAVMQMPEHGIQQKSNCPGFSCEEEDKKKELVQAKPLAEQITPLVQREVEEEDEEEILQTRNTGGSTPEVTHDLESRIQSLKRGGQPLSEKDRAFFELRFGHDCSRVRVHTDEKAARAVNARAFTVGGDGVFGMGEYAPGTSEGQRLLAHELAHVVQQKDRMGHGRGNLILRNLAGSKRQNGSSHRARQDRLTAYIDERNIELIIFSKPVTLNRSRGCDHNAALYILLYSKTYSKIYGKW